MLPSTIGLSSWVKGVPLYCTQSMVRSSNCGVSLVGVQETAVLARNESLERELGSGSAHGLSAKHLALDSDVGTHWQLMFNNLVDFAKVGSGKVCSLCDSFNLFHCDKILK